MQPVHCRSLAVVPALETYCPALHVVHAVQLIAFAPVLYVPAAQGLHCRSVVLVPALETYWPATQSLQVTHCPADA